MRNLYKILAVAFLLMPLSASAISVSWDRPAVGRINPINILDTVFGNIFHATSTTQASIFPYASTTVTSATALCLSTDCRTVWPSALVYTGTYPIVVSGTVISTAFGTTTSNIWAGTQTFTNSPIFSTVGAGTVNSLANGTIYNTPTSTPSVTGPITYSGTLGQFIGGVSGTFGCASCVTQGTASSTITGITGQVVYMQGTNSPIGTSSLFITPSGNVGIGTTTPLTSLVVVPATNGGGIRIDGTSGSAVATLRVDLNSTAYTNLQTVAITNAGFVGGTPTTIGDTILKNIQANAILFGTTNAERMRIDASGNVAIGTTTTTDILQLDLEQNAATSLRVFNDNAGTAALSQLVAQSNGANLAIRANGSGFTGTQYGLNLANYGEFFSNQGSGLAIGTRGQNNPIVFGNSNTERLRVDAGGNIGVATSSPTGLFTIEQGTENKSFFVGNNGSTTPSLVVNGVNGNGFVGIGTAAPDSVLTVNLSTSTIPSPINNGNNLNPFFHLVGGESGLAPRVLLDSVRVLTGINGRRANGSWAAPSALNAEDQIFNLAIFGFGATNYRPAQQGFIGFFADGNWTDTSSPSRIEFGTSNTTDGSAQERMRIASTGFVGIGTTSPFATLSVVGNGTAPVFAVSTSTSANALPNFEIDANGHIVTSGPAPSCNANCTLLAGNDNAFRIRTAAAVSSETITFVKSWGVNAPICQATEGGNTVTPIVIAASTTPTAVVLTNASLSAKDIDVSCEGIQ